ncbi:MAG: hypothetical protein FI731_01490 [SAR202 cluster bacterium]|nr:hypothetical protein [SAR202 cluster bacterium]
MSTRLGIDLVVEPAFTARAYRVRNVVCGQYASWAAEMHTLRMSVVPYFQCSDTAVDLLAQRTGSLAEQSRRRSPKFSINCRGVANGRNGNGDGGTNGQNNSVYLDFEQTDLNHPLAQLQREALALVEDLPGATAPDGAAEYHPKINLMEFANLPPTVMADAAEFAKGVSIDMGVPAVARAWRLVILRYHSDAAGDDWDHGGWANDLRWEYLASYVL